MRAQMRATNVAVVGGQPVRDVNGRSADYDDDVQLFGYPNPFAALDELRSTGTLARIPSTRLT